MANSYYAETDTTPLSDAIYNGDFKKFDALINLGLKVSDRCFKVALQKGYYDFAQELFEKYPLDINSPNSDGYTPLLCCFGFGYKIGSPSARPTAKIIQFMIDKGANTKAVDMFNRNMLILASENFYDLEVFELVLKETIKNKQDLNAFDNITHKTALHCLAWKYAESNSETCKNILIAIERLLKSGANINSLDVNNNNVLDYATCVHYSNHSDIKILVEYLFRNGVECQLANLFQSVLPKVRTNVRQTMNQNTTQTSAPYVDGVSLESDGIRVVPVQMTQTVQNAQ